MNFTVMAKPVGAACNLECSYCYYRGADLSVMSEETLETFIRQYIEASPGPVVSFVWHGGEPMLAGLDFYRTALRLQEKYLPSGWECWNNLQTNGTLLNEECCAFLAESRFDVGLSIDGTRAVHDAHRGEGTHSQAESALRRLQAHGIQPDLLCTVTAAAAADPLAIYKALRSYGTGWLQFIPIVGKAEGVSPAAYGEFLCAVFDEWAINDQGSTEIQMFAETKRIWAGGSAGLCWMAPTCGRAIIVEQDGSVYSCDHFVNPAHRLGNINETHIKELAGLRQQQAFGKAKHPDSCKSCEWFLLCGGGCPKDRQYLCGGLQKFFEYTKPAMQLIVALEKSGYAPEAVMMRLRDELRKVWKGVGRNDPCPCGSGRKAKGCCWRKKAF